MPTDLLEEIIVCTLELTDETGRLLSPPFRVLFSQEVGFCIDSAFAYISVLDYYVLSQTSACCVTVVYSS